MISNVTDYLEESAARFPEKIAFADENKELSYEVLRKNARAIAAGLVKKEIFKKPVVVYLEKGVDCISAFMGAAYSGNFYTPIDVTMPGSRAEKILSTLEPACIITDKVHLEQFSENGLPEWTEKAVLFDELTREPEEAELLSEVRSQVVDTDVLYVLFTSGSTGLPKGVTITHRSVIDYTEWVTKTFAISEQEVFGNQAPFYFDNSILDIYNTLKNGATTFIIPKELFAQPVKLLEYINEKKINIIFWVPSAMIMVARLKAFRDVDISGVKKVLFCGEVMPNKCLNVWRKYLPDTVFANLYGPTEITDACTYYIANREFADEEPLPIGIPCYNTSILVLNEKDEPVSGDEQGELCVRGTSLALGYYNNPEKTSAAFVQNPLQKSYPEIIYRTGDLVKYNEYGELMYLSRKDFQIKHLGHRIELGEIETAVSSLPEISLCCCLYDTVRNKIVLFVEGEIQKETILSGIKELVPDYMYPGKVVCVEKMPINANGKIDRVKLKELL